ncbi:host attachment family protein [Hyphobacterium marinum]|uniref:Host attachment family protein n=1 Tax=Hyphobacterium marinum TaxID=3116574 RepID=A0ABU7LYY6_9PROT|nr:host attachment family protein [Hyphobacterium sp. Y6023]MEE2566767.1 host attachment family protein [Hyphobacterium sp. Y6023]
MTHGPQKTLWVVAMDGAKALIYRNEGDADYPVLKPVEIEKQDVPPTREIVSDKPGRMFDGTGHRSAMDEGDAHQYEEAEFARDTVEFLNAHALKDDYGRLIIFAASRTLGVIRPEYHDALKERLIGEFDIDVVNEPVDALEKRVHKALESA